MNRVVLKLIWHHCDGWIDTILYYENILEYGNSRISHPSWFSCSVVDLDPTSLVIFTLFQLIWIFKLTLWLTFSLRFPVFSNFRKLHSSMFWTSHFYVHKKWNFWKFESMGKLLSLPMYLRVCTIYTTNPVWGIYCVWDVNWVYSNSWTSVFQSILALLIPEFGKRAFGIPWRKVPRRQEQSQCWLMWQITYFL